MAGDLARSERRVLGRLRGRVVVEAEVPGEHQVHVPALGALLEQDVPGVELPPLRAQGDLPALRLGDVREGREAGLAPSPCSDALKAGPKSIPDSVLKQWLRSSECMRHRFPQ